MLLLSPKVDYSSADLLALLLIFKALFLDILGGIYLWDIDPLSLGAYVFYYFGFNPK